MHDKFARNVADCDVLEKPFLRQYDTLRRERSQSKSAFFAVVGQGNVKIFQIGQVDCGKLRFNVQSQVVFVNGEGGYVVVFRYVQQLSRIGVQTVVVGNKQIGGTLYVGKVVSAQNA